MARFERLLGDLMAEGSTQEQARPALTSFDSQAEQTDEPRDKARSANASTPSKTQSEQKGRFDPACHWGRSY